MIDASKKYSAPPIGNKGKGENKQIITLFINLIIQRYKVIIIKYNAERLELIPIILDNNRIRKP